VDRTPSIWQLLDGSLICTFATDEDGQLDIKCVFSYDGGATWTPTPRLIYSDGNNCARTSVRQFLNGEIVVAFVHVSGGLQQILLSKSLDNGQTWLSPYTVVGANAWRDNPSLFLAPSGELFCLFIGFLDETRQKLSLDRGETWIDFGNPILTHVAQEWRPSMALSDAGYLMFVVEDQTNNNIWAYTGLGHAVWQTLFI
jgi:hypothetical protein